jgi:ER membrane protein complex subunit 2
MNTDDDLPTLIRRKDHLNVLRYIRVHAQREPGLVIEHAKALMGDDLSLRKPSDKMSRLAVLEQVCLAALDKLDHDLAALALQRLNEGGVEKSSVRFRRLLGRCMESEEMYEEADKLYDELLSDNPSNLLVLKRKYCIRKAQSGKEVEAVKALNQYLEQNYSDPAAWYEMAQLRKQLGDYKGASFALEEVVLITPLDSNLHCELAECYACIGGLDRLLAARKHMAQALELDSSNRRAQYGLAVIADSYVNEAAKAKKGEVDEYEIEVAKELVKYASEQLIASYEGRKMHAGIRDMMSKYIEDTI